MTITRRTMLSLIAGVSALPRRATAASGGLEKKELWWQNSIFYEIYPRSFQDGNGDGIGDFIGMSDRIDHLVDLGVDAVWISACFDSPNADNGYDVRNYRKIMPQFGTMQDFEYFLECAKKRGIRVILDMVFNHTSDEHPWFVLSRSSRESPYRDFYHWHDGHDGGPPTNWPSAFGGPAWTMDPNTGQYYLHTFAAKQPDLNWENPLVRNQLYDILKFWIDKGVDGFRFDAITSIAKPAKLQDLSASDLVAGHPFAEHGERLNSYLHDMNKQCFAGSDLYAVGETWGADHTLFMAIADSRRQELSSGFRFDFQMKDIQGGWRKLQFKLEDLRAFNADNAFDDYPTTWPVVWLEDHDFPRSVSRFGSQKSEFRKRSAKLLATMMLSLRGTPFIYQGQEIGMRNYPFTSIEQFDDVSAHNAWAEQVGCQKMSPADMLANLAASTRDNARTPMQWSMNHNAGFSTGKSWLPVNPDYRTINVQAESQDPHSVLTYYKAMIALRKAHPALVHGRYRDISPDNSTLYAYRRDHPSGKVLVILNFSDSEVNFPLPDKIRLGKILISNMPERTIIGSNLLLAPWESMIVTF